LTCRDGVVGPEKPRSGFRVDANQAMTLMLFLHHDQNHVANPISSILSQPSDIMGLIVRGVRAASRMPRTSLWTSQYRSASRATYTVPIAQPELEKHWHISTLDQCPSPTCQCRETPEGLDIDRETKLNGTMPAYAEQVIISTGRTDWKSRIQEDDDSAFVNQLAKFTGPKGKFSDVCYYCRQPRSTCC
jgi:hypothetical protein